MTPGASPRCPRRLPGPAQRTGCVPRGRRWPLALLLPLAFAACTAGDGAGTPPRPVAIGRDIHAGDTAPGDGADGAAASATDGSSPGGNVDAESPLRHLGMLVGTWEGQATSTVLATGEQLVSEATTQVEWSLGNRFLVERTERHMEVLGSSTALGVWTHDAAVDIYRYWRFSSNGIAETGTMTFDAGTQTFLLVSRSLNLVTGGEVRGEGAMRYISEDEKRYVWTSYDEHGDVAYEVRGRSTRVDS